MRKEKVNRLHMSPLSLCGLEKTRIKEVQILAVSELPSGPQFGSRRETRKPMIAMGLFPS